MPDPYVADQSFKGSKVIEPGEYENCTFLNCILPNSDLSGIKFIECEFENCDISSSKIYDTSFNEVLFKNSKLLGLRFEECNPFLFSLDCVGCNLSLSSFYQMNPKSVQFKNCNLKEVDFTECNLADTVFDDCNLNLTTFRNTNLVRADFQTASSFSIDPESNAIEKATFSLQGLPGLLEKYNLKING